MYWTLFLTFVKIGTFTIGGGYAMLPLIQREVVDKGWLSKEDFIDLFSLFFFFFFFFYIFFFSP